VSTGGILHLWSGHCCKLQPSVIIIIIIAGSACEAGATAELVASHKEEKYASFESQYLFAAVTVETLGPMNTSACPLFANLGRKISSTSGDNREGDSLFQRVSVLVQRYNAVLLHDTLPAPNCTD